MHIALCGRQCPLRDGLERALSSGQWWLQDTSHLALVIEPIAREYGTDPGSMGLTKGHQQEPFTFSHVIGDRIAGSSDTGEL